MFDKFIISLLFLTAAQANAYILRFMDGAPGKTLTNGVLSNKEPFYEASMDSMTWVTDGGKLYWGYICPEKEEKNLEWWKNNIANKLFPHAKVIVTQELKKKGNSSDPQIVFTFQFNENIAREMEVITGDLDNSIFKEILQLLHRRSKEAEGDSWTFNNAFKSYQWSYLHDGCIKNAYSGVKNKDATLKLIDFLLFVGTPKNIFTDLVCAWAKFHCGADFHPVTAAVFMDRNDEFFKKIKTKIESAKKLLPKNHWVHTFKHNVIKSRYNALAQY